MWGRGYKFSEFSSSPDTLACLYDLLAKNWAGGRVAFIGSYTEYSEGDVVVNQDVDALQYKPIEAMYKFKLFGDPGKLTPQVDLWDIPQFFLVNETKRRYFFVDVREFGEFAINAVCWMLADASCFMYGDGKINGGIISIPDSYGELDNPVGIPVLTRSLGTWAYDELTVMGGAKNDAIMNGVNSGRPFPGWDSLKRLREHLICEDKSFTELCRTWKTRKQWWDKYPYTDRQEDNYVKTAAKLKTDSDDKADKKRSRQ